MGPSSSLRLLLNDLRQVFGARLTGLLTLMVLVSLTEGLSIALIFPLLTLLGIGDGGGNRIIATLFQAFDAAGLPRSAWTMLGLVIAVAVVQAGLFLAQSWLAARMQHDYCALWRRQLFDAIMHAKWRFFTEKKSGEMLNAIMNETNRLSGAFYLLAQLAATAVVTSINILLALAMSWQATLVLLAAGLMLATAMHGFSRRTYRIGMRLGPLNNDLQSLGGEFIGGAKLIKATATETDATRRIAGIVDEMRDNYVLSSFLPAVVRGGFDLVGVSVICAVFVAGPALLSLDPANILVVMALFVRLFPRLVGIQQNLHTLNVYLPAIGILRRLTDEARAAAEQASAEARQPVPEKPRLIRLEQVVVRYDGRAVLDGVSLDLPAGATVGIAGGSGAGKSTLVDCLLRLVEPSEGRILIDGHDLRAVSLTGWRRRVGYVAQDTVLFHASVRDNLLWGCPGASEEEMIAAARRACAHDFILDMPEGYGTVIGDRGVRLSGGQRQRLGLARALMRKPALLLLDEATSALDAEAERGVLDAIQGLRGEIIIVMVAHRLSTLRFADVIHVLDGGQLAESGGWSDLVGAEGRFAAAWQLQNKG